MPEKERSEPEVRPGSAPSRASGRTTLITIGSLGALIAGMAIGLVAHSSQHPMLLAGAAAVEPIGTLWVNALRMVVIPLIASHLFVAIVAAPDGRGAGRLGILSVGSFVALLGLAFLFTYAVLPSLLGWLDIDAATQAMFRESAGVEATAQVTGGPGHLAAFLRSIIPTNPFEAAATDDLLGVIVFIAIFGLAARRIVEPLRGFALTAFRALAATTTVIVQWLLLVLPLGVFAIAYGLTAQTGFEIAGVLGFFVVAVSGLMLAFTLFLYPIAAILGRVSVRRFAAGVAASQAVALGSRSSLASLPALLRGADERIGVPPAVSALVLPLAVSTFKVNRGISSPLKLLFLAHVYGIAVEPGFLLVFAVTVILLSFSSPGIPGGGAMVTTSVYLAAGIPLQGILLLEAVDAIPDMFKTLVNVTADMTVAVVVARLAGVPVATHVAPVVGVPAGSPAAAP